MSSIQDVINAFANSVQDSRPIVKFNPRIEDHETYFDRGMMATVVDIQHDSVYDGVAMYKIHFNVSAFKDHNQKKEQRNWYDNNGDPCLTATEAGFYPKGDLDWVYFMEDEDGYFEIIEDKVFPVTFPDQESYEMAIRAVERMVEIFDLRVDEAKTAEDGKNLRAALEDYEVTLKTLHALKGE